jgi:hypothetical protein
MYRKGDIVLVKCAAGPKVYVRLVKRVLKPKDYWGADGWEAVLLNNTETEKLRKAGVPYPEKGEREVWVYDEDIIKRKNRKKTKKRLKK